VPDLFINTDWVILWFFASSPFYFYLLFLTLQCSVRLGLARLTSNCTMTCKHCKNGGYLDATVLTFPVPWKGVADQILSLDEGKMLPMPRQAAQRLRYYLNLQKQEKRRTFLELQASSDQPRLTSFDGINDVKASAKVTNEFYWGRLSGQLSVNYQSGGEKSLDNSFLAYQFGAWNIRAGSIDQWWGPGQSSSLILSNNTRPIPTVALSRSSAVASESPWLSWAGPWVFYQSTWPTWKWQSGT